MRSKSKSDPSNARSDSVASEAKNIETPPRRRKRLTQIELIDIASFLYDRHEFRMNNQKDKLDGKKELRNNHM
jgi:hypothetical protein